MIIFPGGGGEEMSKFLASGGTPPIHLSRENTWGWEWGFI